MIGRYIYKQLLEIKIKVKDKYFRYLYTEYNNDGSFLCNNYLLDDDYLTLETECNELDVFKVI